MASCIILYYRFSLLDVQLETQLAGLDIFSLLFTDSRRKIFLRYKKVETIATVLSIVSYLFLAFFCYSQFPDLIFLGLFSTNSIKQFEQMVFENTKDPYLSKPNACNTIKEKRAVWRYIIFGVGRLIFFGYGSTKSQNTHFLRNLTSIACNCICCCLLFLSKYFWQL